MTIVEELTLQNRLRSMLELQDCINSKIRPDWRDANNAWFRAIWTECAELVDHIGWKWWKHQAPDLPQVHLELVDIFHFGLSESLQLYGSAENAVKELLETYLAYGRHEASEAKNSEDCIVLVETFATSVLTTRRFDLAAFSELANAVQLEEETLYESYVGKNVLNRFRQDHGYKSGTYVKNWDGREDNIWLVEFAGSLDKNPASFATELYQRLLKKYEEVACAG